MDLYHKRRIICTLVCNLVSKTSGSRLKRDWGSTPLFSANVIKYLRTLTWEIRRLDYQKHYERLIRRARSRPNLWNEIFERHHIVPKCEGGTDEQDNIVKLTPEEHYVAHQLLYKIYKSSSLLHAVRMMTVNRKGNKQYGWMRKRYIEFCRTKVGEKNPSYGKKWYRCPKTHQSGKFLIDDVPTGWVKGRVPPPTPTRCLKCGEYTKSHRSKWCDECRPPSRPKTIYKSQKKKKRYNDEDRKIALRENGMNIRKALFSLGLADGGANYTKMKEILANMDDKNE